VEEYGAIAGDNRRDDDAEVERLNQNPGREVPVLPENQHTVFTATYFSELIPVLCWLIRGSVLFALLDSGLL